MPNRKLRTSRPSNRIQTPDGLFWKRRRGATSTAEEFIEARELFVRLHDESSWSSWVLEERAADLEQAQSIMRQWNRAEPGFRQMTIEEIREEWAREDTEQAAQLAEAEEVRLLRQAQYDPEREQLRLSFLEMEGYLQIKLRDRQGLVDRSAFPAMPEDRRIVAIGKCDSEIALLQPQVDTLRERLGDPETVIDQVGRLPAERRRLLLRVFSSKRQDAVRRLRPEVAQFTAALEHVHGRKERAVARAQLEKKQAELDEWLAIPAVSEDEMCSECPRPAGWHVTGRITVIGWQGPCPSWPRWTERVRLAIELVKADIAKRKQSEAQPALPQSVATIASGLPISEVVARLTELQSQYPAAEIRYGRSGRWEIWDNPAAATD